MNEGKMSDQSKTDAPETPPAGGCAGAHAAWLEGRSGTFSMRAAAVPEIEAPPPVAAKPAPPTSEVFAICGSKDVGDRRGKSFPLMRMWDDGKARPWEVFIARFGKQYFAYVNECPHSGQRLDWEKNNFFEPTYQKVLMCGKHGAQFELDTGACMSGPCKGASLQKIDCIVDEEDDVCLIGVNLEIAGETPESGEKDHHLNPALENNGFKLQQTVRTF
jgi:nitrite reductase/ring-hydroxylating ferredoxin subunit